MGIIAGLLEKRSHPSNPEDWLTDWFSGGGRTKSGISVNENTAMNCLAVASCVRILAENVASLPLNIYERLNQGGKKRAPDHELHPLLHDSPNSEMTSLEFREAMMLNLGLWGNAYAEIERNGAGRAVALWPLLSKNMTVKRENGQIWYHYQFKGRKYRLPAFNVLHIKGLSPDGLVGYSNIRIAREAIGLSLSMEEFGARFFENGANSGGTLEHPNSLGDDAYRHLKESLKEQYAGLSRAHRLMILEEGMKFNKISIPPEDAQFLESRKFQLAEIARWYRVPLILLAEYEKAATYASVEQFSIQFVVQTLRPWLVRWEQALLTSLFFENERKKYFAEFVVDGLLRGDIKSRYEAYAIGRQWGWLCADDVLELENRNPLPDGQGKIYLVPMNMDPVSTLENRRSLQDRNIRALQERSVQFLERRTIALRRKLTVAYTSKFDEYGGRIVKLEVDEVRSAVENMLKKRGVTDFLNWIDSFYTDFAKEVDAQAAPLITSYASAVLPIAQDEINSESDISIQYQAFQKEYSEYFADRHVKSSKGQLQAVVTEAQAAGENEADAVLQRLDEWEERRPGKISMRETIRAESAFARSVFGFCGIMKIKSIAFGTNCPYCSALNGKVIGINEYFLTKGDFQPDGADEPLTVTSNRSHPPYHDGCDCGIEASN